MWYERYYERGRNEGSCMRKVDRTGETRVNNQGLKMTIVRYQNIRDIDVQFEDGTILASRNYNKFKIGRIQHPKYKRRVLSRIAKHREININKSFVLHNGEIVSAVQYNGFRDITIQYADGTTQSGVSLSDLKSGYIRHPKDTLTAHRTQRIGEVKLSSCGIYMEIVDYKTSDDISVKFETGYIKHTQYKQFNKYGVGHPFPYQIGNITMNGPAYIYNSEGNFYCFCNKCKKSDTMTIQEIKSHKCIEN